MGRLAILPKVQKAGMDQKATIEDVGTDLEKAPLVDRRTSDPSKPSCTKVTKA
jgi:hypothetical protein